MRTTIGLSYLTLSVLFAASCSTDRASPSPTQSVPTPLARQDEICAITHVTVIDPGSDAVPHRDMTILVRGTRIAAVGLTGAVTIPVNAVVHDASGRFIVPGFWDAHVHLSQVGPAAFPLFVANGITSVRDMGSDFTEVSRWKADRAAGGLIPRIITPGPKLDGGSFVQRILNWHNQERRIVTSPPEARQAVDSLKAEGVDFIKVHNGLSPPLYDAIVAECRKDRLPFAGHLPVAGPLAAAAAGQRTIEHGRGMLLCSDATWTNIHADPKLQKDAEYCAPLSVQPELFPALRHAGTWFTPTLVSWRGHAMVGDAALSHWIAALNGSASVWPALRRHWDDMAGPTPTAFERRLQRQFDALAAGAARAGVPLLAGTDLGDPYVIPGFALHDELELMVEAGVTPLAALRSATIEPARAFELAYDLGTIEPGKAADLVLLEEDPLVDIRNTRRVSVVVLNGHWLPHN